MDTPTNNFEKLCNKIRAKAIEDIEQNLSQSQLVKWQKLLKAILETELAIHRVRSALKSLKAIPTEESLRLLSMSRGTWIDYHFGTWSFWMFGLIEKEIKLISEIGQRLIKPNNPNHKDITRPLILSLVSKKDSVGKIRHPLAHEGERGIIESIVNTESWKDYVKIPSPMDYNQILDSYVPYHIKRHNKLHMYSTSVLAELYQTSEQLNQHIDWGKI